MMVEDYGPNQCTIGTHISELCGYSHSAITHIYHRISALGMVNLTALKAIVVLQRNPGICKAMGHHLSPFQLATAQGPKKRSVRLKMRTSLHCGRHFGS